MFARLTLACCPCAGELLSPTSLEGMDEGAAMGEEAGAAAAACASASTSAEPEETLAQPSPLPLVESIDEALAPDIIAGTPGSSSSVFQSALVGPSVTTFPLTPSNPPFLPPPALPLPLIHMLFGNDDFVSWFFSPTDINLLFLSLIELHVFNSSFLFSIVIQLLK